MNDNILELKNVNITYYGGYAGCNNLDFCIKKGSKIAILGMNNSGKSTLLKALGGIESYQGSILYNGTELREVPIKERNFGMNLDSLPRRGNVFNAIAYPMKLRKYNKTEIAKSLFATAEKFNIVDILQCSISKLSAQQRALVKLARLFVIERDVYLVDNPLQDVYITERELLASDIALSLLNTDKTVIIACDTLKDVAAINPDKVVVLCYNSQHDEGTLASIYNRPQSLAVAKLMYEDKPTLLTGAINSGILYIQDKAIGEYNLIGNNFDNVQCLVPYNSVKLDKKGEKATIKRIYAYPKMYLVELSANDESVYIELSSDHSLSVGQEIRYSIDYSKSLIYDDFSGKIISKCGRDSELCSGI